MKIIFKFDCKSREIKTGINVSYYNIYLYDNEEMVRDLGLIKFRKNTDDEVFVTYASDLIEEFDYTFRVYRESYLENLQKHLNSILRVQLTFLEKIS